MKEREKIIKALECCSDAVSECGKNCPYWNIENCQSNMQADALALLKAQEPCDAVSKQAVISALEGEYSDWNDDYNIPITHCIKAVQSLPSVQLVPVARVMTLDLPSEEWQDKVIWLKSMGKSRSHVCLENTAAE